MLNVHNAAITFSGSYLFQGVSFKLSGGDRVGLIGKNGAGKSTLLKVLSKQMELDEGVMATDKEISIGILRQDIDFVEGRTVLEESYQAFEEILKVENEIDRVNQALAERTDYESGAYPTSWWRLAIWERVTRSWADTTTKATPSVCFSVSDSSAKTSIVSPIPSRADGACASN